MDFAGCFVYKVRQVEMNKIIPFSSLLIDYTELRNLFSGQGNHFRIP